MILKQKEKGLRMAHGRFVELRKNLKKSRCPQDLLDELDAALHLIRVRTERLSSSSS